MTSGRFETEAELRQKREEEEREYRRVTSKMAEDAANSVAEMVSRLDVKARSILEDYSRATTGESVQTFTGTYGKIAGWQLGSIRVQLHPSSTPEKPFFIEVTVNSNLNQDQRLQIRQLGEVLFNDLGASRVTVDRVWSGGMARTSFSEPSLGMKSAPGGSEHIGTFY